MKTKAERDALRSNKNRWHTQAEYLLSQALDTLDAKDMEIDRLSGINKMLIDNLKDTIANHGCTCGVTTDQMCPVCSAESILEEIALDSAT